LNREIHINHKNKEHLRGKMIPKLAVLGLLCRKDMHGYEIIKKVNEEMTNFCDLKIGSVYFAINTLKKEGYIEFKSKIAGKNEPDKTVYGITEKGKEEFIKVLRKALLKAYAGRYPIDLAFHFKEHLAETDFRRIIADKIYIADRVVNTLSELHLKEKDLLTKSILKHQILHQTAELEWLKDLLESND
jgi:DNA-binding PadR family transcriptional regulator